MSVDALSGVVGPSGVGALCMLGVFFLLDGRAPSLFPTVETYAKTSTWGVVAAVPLVVMAYVAGLFLTSAMEFLVGLAFHQDLSRDAADLVRVASFAAEKPSVVQTYLQLRADRGVLAGSSLSLLVVGVGAISEIVNLPHLRSAIRALSASVLILSASAFFLAGRKGAEAHALVTQLSRAEVSQPAPSSR